MDQISLNFLKTRLNDERKIMEQLNFQFMAHPVYHQLKQAEYAVQVLEEEIAKIEGVVKKEESEESLDEN